MVNMRGIRLFSRNGALVLLSTGLAGWYSGKLVERATGNPFMEYVSAATPISKEDRTPVVSTGEIMKYGFPSLDNVRSFDDYVLSYDKRNKVPNWVFEHLTASKLKFNPSIDRSKVDFMEDSSVHQYFRSTNKDYKGSGFDRGHLAAAGNHRLDQRHVEQTFYLSNIAPQIGEGFNRDAWNRLEKYVRKLTKTYANVYVCSGPLYMPIKENNKKYIKYQVIGENNVAVPTHFFKVVVMEDYQQQFHLEAYVMPNAVIPNQTPLTAFQVPVDLIERSSGLLFFDRLAREKIKFVNGRKTTWL